jgi:hypothetical protein
MASRQRIAVDRGRVRTPAGTGRSSGPPLPSCLPRSLSWQFSGHAGRLSGNGVRHAVWGGNGWGDRSAATKGDDEGWERGDAGGLELPILEDKAADRKVEGAVRRRMRNET